MKIKKIATITAIILATLFSLPSNLFAQKKYDDYTSYELTNEEIKVLFEKKRDPLFAGILSFYMPGLGQFYNDEKIKGASFLVAEYTIVIGSLLYFLDFNFKAGGGSGFNLKVDAKRTELGVISAEKKHLFYVTLGTLSVIHIYNIIDAVNGAQNFNAQLQKSRQELLKKYPQLHIGYNSYGGINIGFAHCF